MINCVGASLTVMVIANGAQLGNVLLVIKCIKNILERFSLDCRKTKTKVNTLANQRA